MTEKDRWDLLLGAAKFVLALVSSLGTAVWAVRTWSEDKARAHAQRELEAEALRDRAAALYINPLMQAAEDLQSRLFNLRDRRGLATLRERDPSGSYGAETVALLARYLAWQRVTFRQGPHARGPGLI